MNELLQSLIFQLGVLAIATVLFAYKLPSQPCASDASMRLAFSNAWLSDWLSTLRSADYSNTSQGSLPVAGQALLDGISTRMVPLKDFRVVNYISFSFPKLAWRNGRVITQIRVSSGASVKRTNAGWKSMEAASVA